MGQLVGSTVAQAFRGQAPSKAPTGLWGTGHPLALDLWALSDALAQSWYKGLQPGGHEDKDRNKGRTALGTGEH